MLASAMMIAVMNCAVDTACHITTIKKDYWIVQVTPWFPEGKYWNSLGLNGLNRNEINSCTVVDPATGIKFFFKVGEHKQA